MSTNCDKLKRSKKSKYCHTKSSDALKRLVLLVQLQITIVDIENAKSHAV